jgi:hypothetical protein
MTRKESLDVLESIDVIKQLIWDDENFTSIEAMEIIPLLTKLHEKWYNAHARVFQDGV